MKYVLLRVGDTMELDEVNVPKSSDDWFEPTTNTANGEPIFDKVDNPDGWSGFSYRLVFVPGEQGGQYMAHCLPYSCHSVPRKKYDAVIITHGG